MALAKGTDMRQPLSINRALYGRSPGWFLPVIFGTVLGLGLLSRLGRRDASAFALPAR